MKRLAFTICFVLLCVAGISAQSQIPIPIPVTSGSAIGKTAVMKTGTLTSTLATADQVVLTYTVTAGKTFYVEYFDLAARLTTYASTATNFGDCSLESPAGTKLWTQMFTNIGQSAPLAHDLGEPIPIAAGVVIRIVCTPSATTSFFWRANFGGYER